MVENRKKNLYQVLGLVPNSSKEEINSAYRYLAKKYHTDLNKDPFADSIIRIVNFAYSVLKNEEKKRIYDIKMGFIKNPINMPVSLCTRFNDSQRIRYNQTIKNKDTRGQNQNNSKKEPFKSENKKK